MHSLGKSRDKIQGFSLPRERVLRLRLLAEKNHGIAVYIIRNLLRYIINFAEIVYHHCERVYSLRLMRYSPCRDILGKADEMHAKAWWYTIAFAMDKKAPYRREAFFHRRRYGITSEGDEEIHAIAWCHARASRNSIQFARRIDAMPSPSVLDKK